MAVTAALMLAAFSACGDGDEASDGDDDAVITLPEPIGIDPFENRYYSPDNDWEFFGEKKAGGGYRPRFAGDPVRFDTSARTMELLDNDKKLYGASAQFKYTYDDRERTVTFALAKVPIAADISKYVEAVINWNNDNDADYDNGGYKLGSLSEYKKWIDTLAANKAILLGTA